MNRKIQKNGFFDLSMNRKGQYKEVQYGIMALVILVILLGIPSLLNTGFDKATRGQDCLTSIILKTLTSVETMFARYRGIDASCPRYDVNIGKKKTVINKGLKKFETKKYDVLTNDEVNGILADELMYCWKQFGEGKLETFWLAQRIDEKITNFDEHTQGCRVCSAITFDNDVSNDVSGTFEGFYEYLKTHTINTKLKVNEGGKATYYNFLTSDDAHCNEEHLKIKTDCNALGLFCTESVIEGPNCWEKYASKNNIDIEKTFQSGTNYFVVFTRKGVRKSEGTINAYIMSEEEYTNGKICQNTLPFQK